MLVHSLALLTHFLGTAGFARTLTLMGKRCLYASTHFYQRVGPSVRPSCIFQKSKNPKMLFFGRRWYQNESGNSLGPFSYTLMHTSAHTCTRTHPHVMKLTTKQNPDDKTYTHARAYSHKRAAKITEKRQPKSTSLPSQDDKRRRTGHKYTHEHVYPCDCVWFCVTVC